MCAAKRVCTVLRLSNAPGGKFGGLEACLQTEIIWHYSMAPLSLHCYFSMVSFLSCSQVRTAVLSCVEVWNEIQDEVNAEISAS